MLLWTMAFKTIILLSFVFSVTFAKKTLIKSKLTECTKENALFAVKRPVYEFSVRLLDKVAIETSGHFVYSPLSTWSDLMAIADGAIGRTWSEILKVCKIPLRRRQKCFGRLFRMVLNDVENALKGDLMKIGLIIVDELFKIRKHFKTEVEMESNLKVLPLNFDDPVESTWKANEIIRDGTDGVIEEAIYPGDFNLSTLFLTKAVYFKSDWKFPFDKTQTILQPFYNEEKIKEGDVNMMNQISYFNLAVIPLIKSKVLELPFANDRVSMFVFLPLEEIKYNSIKDFYYYVKETNLIGILNRLKIEGQKLVNVSLPRFNITTDLEENELLFDMGLKRIFYPDKAKLLGISNYTLNVSLLKQVSKITVTEESVSISANAIPQSVIKTEDSNIVQFNANKPFAYMIADKQTQLILYAGMYNVPKLS